MRVLVIGSGAIGTFIGGVLASSGQDVTLMDLPPVVEALKAGGLEVGGLGRPIRERNFKAVPGIEGEEPFDLAVLAVKSYSTADAVASLPPGGAGLILTFQNGIGNEELLAKKFGREKVVAGSITYPVAFEGPGRVTVENSKGGLALSPLVPARNVAGLVEMFSNGGLDAVTVADYRGMKWSKLLLNLVCNATCAILGMGPGGIFSDRRLVRIEREQMLEALRVMGREEIPLLDLPGYAIRKMAAVFRYAPPSVLKLVMRGRIAKARGEKKPSLLLEMEKGSGKTEVEFMNGAVYRHSCSMAMKAPVNKILFETLSDIAKGFIPADEFRDRPEAFVNLFK